MTRKQYEFAMKSKSKGIHHTTDVDANSFEIALKAINDAYGHSYDIDPVPLKTLTDPATFVWTGIHCD
jgi:hypothetical protein